MKRRLVVLAAMTLAVPVQAQFFGLPVADGAASPAAGDVQAVAGMMMGDDFDAGGGRLLFAPVPRLLLFADLGILNPDRGDWGPAFQGGARFTLPFRDESPLDVALQAAGGLASCELDAGDLRMQAFNAGALASRSVGIITPDAFLGLCFTDAELDLKEKHKGKNSHNETDLAAAAGIRVRCGSQFSIYGEIAHVDELKLGAGAGWKF